MPNLQGLLGQKITPSGSFSFDTNGSGYRIAGTISWNVIGKNVNWTISGTSYEYCVWNNSQQNYIFQGLTNSYVSLSVGSYTATTSSKIFSGYGWGTHASRSGWVSCNSFSLVLTTSILKHDISVVHRIVAPNVSGTNTVNLYKNTIS